MPVCNKAVFAYRIYSAGALMTTYRTNNHVKHINRVSQGVCIRCWLDIWRFTKSPLLNTYCNITIRYSPRCLIVIDFKFGFAYCISDRAITAAWCFPRDNRAMPALFSKGEHKRMLLYCACTFAISPLHYMPKANHL